MNKIDNNVYQDLIGKEFKYMARGKDNKYDCLGLIYEMHKRLNIPMPEQESIIDKKLRQAAFEKGKDLFTEIPFPEPGCVVGFRIYGIVNHVGIMLDNLRFIHIQRHKRVCIEKISDLKWSKRVEGFYKFSEKK